MTVSYPRLAARTARFTLGIPRNLTVSPDGSKVWYIRTPGRRHAHRAALGARRRHRHRDRARRPGRRCSATPARSCPPRSGPGASAAASPAAGLVDFAVDDTGRWASLRAVRAGCGPSTWPAAPSRRCRASAPVIDPRVDPTGRHVAYAAGGALRVIGVDGTDERALVEPESPTEVWGQAEFIAAEELDRFRGFWWAPDGGSLLVERYDEAPVHVWHVADPEHPDREPAAQRYPAAGTPNAIVTLWHVGLDGSRTEIVWDREAFEYLVGVTWTPHGDPVLQVMSRDQRRAQVLAADAATGATRVLRDLADDDWVEVVAPHRGTPRAAGW